MIRFEELVVRTYHEAQGKPIYMVREVLSPEQSQQQDQHSYS